MPLHIEADSSRNFLGMYPSETATAAFTIDKEERLEFSRFYSAIYRSLSKQLAADVGSLFAIDEQAVRIICRRALVSTTHCYLDNLLRLAKVKEKQHGNIQIHKTVYHSAANSIEELENWSLNSLQFNQFMLWFVSRVFQLPLIEQQTMIRENPSSFFGKNHLFKIDNNSLFDRARRLFFRLYSKCWSPQGLYCLPLANTAAAFEKYGFFAKQLQKLDIDTLFPEGLFSAQHNRDMRQQIFAVKNIQCQALEDFFHFLQFTAEEIERGYYYLSQFLVDFFPTQALELVPIGLRYLQPYFKNYRYKYLITESGQNSKAQYFVAAAKLKGIKIIDLQHGGLYGYIKDMVAFTELEFPDVDHFISWGWLQLEKENQADNITVYALASPWLSERRRYWQKNRCSRKRAYDILYMPNMVKQFLPLPHGESTCRRDRLPAYIADMCSLVNALCRNHYRVLHKPYNQSTIQLLSKTLNALEEKNGQYFHYIRKPDKGLHQPLISNVDIIVWDQPGTGFLECLSSGIVTLVLWTKIYNHESTQAIAEFKALQQVGIVHNSIDSLLQAIQHYQTNRSHWLQDAQRQQVISAFIDKYARVSQNWQKQWRDYFHDCLHE